MDPVIQAIGKLVFEDGLRIQVLPGIGVGTGCGVVVMWTMSDQTPTCLIPHASEVFRLQLLCGGWIELT